MTTPHFYNAHETESLLDFDVLVRALAQAAVEHAAGAINAPTRHAVPYSSGGTMLSMPATAHDIGIHKLVNVMPQNQALGLPTIQGVITAFDSEHGQVLFMLDGPTVTNRRTAAISMLGLRTFLPHPPTHVALLGTGSQADGHAQALAALYPGIDVTVVSRTLENAERFVRQHDQLPLAWTPTTQLPDDADALITLTTSLVPLYDLPGQAGRLLIGVGAFKPDMAEIGPRTLFSSHIYTDDPEGAQHEAGDLIQAGVDWTSVYSLAQGLAQAPDLNQPIVFKSVGCAAWDLAAVRCIRDKVL